MITPLILRCLIIMIFIFADGLLIDAALAAAIMLYFSVLLSMPDTLLRTMPMIRFIY